MSDAFALLALPRAAVLDDAVLQQAYLAASRLAHPDQPGGGTAPAAAINAAYETLQAPEKRLKHLLELHHVPWRSVVIDDATMTIFNQLGPALQNVAAFLKRKQAAASALAQALLAPDEMRLREQIEILGTNLDSMRTALLAVLPALDVRLTTDDIAALSELQTVQAKLAYISKWQMQVREALLSLM